MSVDLTTVKRVAHLARIAVSEEQAEKMTGELNVILGFVQSLDAVNVDVRGAEPCLIGEKCIGLTTSGGYGHRVAKSLFFACVPIENAAPGSTFDIVLQGERRVGTVLEHPAYDPDNSKMKV